MSAERSPSGKLVLQNAGPSDAELVVLGSPGDKRSERGDAVDSKVLNGMLAKAGIEPETVRKVRLVPVEASKWSEYSADDIAWAKAKLDLELRSLRAARVFVLLGSKSLHWIAGLDNEASIDDWRGSTLSVAALRRTQPAFKEDYLPLVGAYPHSALPNDAVLVPTFHPIRVADSWEAHPWLIMDLARAKRYLASPPSQPRREWFYNDVAALQRLAERLKTPALHSGVIAIDTESWPYNIVGLATEDEVHVFAWDERFREALTSVLASPFVIKVAHNLQHDWTHLRKRIGIDVAQPWFDTMGAAHVLNNGLEKNLSPAIATRFTDWPFHKWLVNINPLLYNGMDNVVAYDAYAPQLAELVSRGLYDVAKHDHALLAPLLDMQWHGFRIDEAEQGKAAEELNADRLALVDELNDDVKPIVDAKLGKFVKPHLFEVERRCDHCGGGKVSAQHCWRCGGLAKKPEKKSDYFRHAHSLAEACTISNCTVDVQAAHTVQELRESLPVCMVCGGTGKIRVRLAFNPESADQVADVLYRGLGIRPRKYKGVETVRVGQIEPLGEQYPLAAKLASYARLNAEHETVERLRSGPDGRLHCVFDPFGTDSGRVASKEGLIEPGTNAMNIPKKARRLVIPDDGYVFLYPDKAAVEARAIAVLSQDQQLIQLFNDGADVHMLVRDDMRKLGAAFAAFSRDQAKRLEYATFYGGRAEQVARELSDEALRKGEGMAMNAEQTQLAMDALLSGRFQGVQRWHDRIGDELLRTRKVKSPTGRERVWLERIYDPKTKGVKYEILKQGWSFGPQDIGAWVLGDGLLSLWHDGWAERWRGLIHVHDALVIQVLRSRAEELKHEVQARLTNTYLGMRFPTEMKQGDNWYEAS